MRVQIVKTGFSTVSVEVPEGSTISYALQQGNVQSDGFNIVVNGSVAMLSDAIHPDTRAISLVGKVKGGGDITVKVVKFGQQTVPATVPSGSTVKDALEAIKYGLDGYTISLNGSPGTLDSVLTDQDIVQLVPKVKGGIVGRVIHRARVFVATWL